MRVVLLTVLCSLVVQANSYDHVVENLEKEYTRKQSDYNKMARADRYRWEFVEVQFVPIGCRDDVGSRYCGEVIWIDGYGQIVRRNEADLFVAVRSWIDRDGKDRAQVTRVFHYQKEGVGWRRSDVYKITENWSEDVGWICQR